MRTISLICGFIFSLGFFTSYAQVLQVYPQPQSVQLEGWVKKPTQYRLKKTKIPKEFQWLFDEVMSSLSEKSNAQLQLWIGDTSDKWTSKYSDKIPTKAESYYLSLSDKKWILIGSDTRGLYYGLQTLSQIVRGEQVPIVEIQDSPDVPARGVVEGFYGTPWTFEGRMRQLDFYGKFKLNTYIYGPKDDPYHSSPNWRKPYPKEEAEQIHQLITQSNKYQVDFVWAIHPGKDIQWNQQDREALIQKFSDMYDLGVRSFAVFFDDISGIGTDATQQAKLLNYIDDEFVQKKEGVHPLIMCPTEYNKSWSNPEKGYLTTLGEELHPSIRIMWTGDRVVADIQKESIDWINQQINRKAFIWWNFPVSDYVRDHLLLGESYGNDLTIADEYSGFVSNPMEHSEASKIAIYGVAGYTWNMKQYRATEAWKSALKEVMPESFSALEVFAKHNSDLGANGHRYRRKESVDFKSVAEQFTENLKKGNITDQDLQSVKNEFATIISASDILLKSKDNPFLMDEIRPWVESFQELGKAGLEAIKMLETCQEEYYVSFQDAHQHFVDAQKKIYMISQTNNQNPYQPGIKVSTLVVEPLVNQIFTTAATQFNQTHNAKIDIQADYIPHQIYTDIPSLSSLPLQFYRQRLSFAPPLEFINWEVQQYLGFQLEKMVNGAGFYFECESSEDIQNFLSLQISKDGKNWVEVDFSSKDNKISKEIKTSFQWIRIINKDSKYHSIKIKKIQLKL